MTADVLVIGYGNTLRGDDGIGPAVAMEIARQELPGVRVIVAHQLTPELAVELAAVRRVVFIDALIGGEPVTVTELAAEPPTPTLTHSTDPRQLLELARVVSGRSPEAWFVAVAGVNFDYREGLSDLAEQHVRLAVERIQGLLRL